MFILGLYIYWHIECHSIGPDGWMVSEAAWQSACPWFDFGPVPWRWQIHIFLFGNFILFKKVFYSNLSRGMLNLPVNVSFNGSDLKTFLSKIINSLMFLDHSHIISSLANQKKKEKKIRNLIVLKLPGRVRKVKKLPRRVRPSS